MTLRIWGRVLVTAVGAGVLVGAGQLGVAYGLGIVRIARSFEGATENQWSAQLAWVSWFAMLAAIAGAALAARAARRHGHTPGVTTRIVLAVFGGIGAGAVIPLSMQPARSAELSESVDPALVVGLAAGLGAVAGVLAAVAVLSLRPLAWNVALVSTAVWVAGLLAVGPYLGPDDPLPSIRLGVPQWTVQAGDTNRLVDTLSMPVLALLVGALVAGVARARREPGLGAAVNGAAGAAPLALAYLIAGPGLRGATEQMAPYLGALIAVPAGLLGSLLVMLVLRREETPVPEASARPGAAQQLEPTNIIPPVAPVSQQRPPAPPLEWPVPPGPPAPPHRPSPVTGSASASLLGLDTGTTALPRHDGYVGWVSGLGSDGDPAQGSTSGGKLPRRTPGQRFPAGT